MKSRRQDLSEDRLVTSGYVKRSKTSVNGIENWESIPIDLVIEILSRLPAKSVAKCRCVSKLWFSLLRRPYFPELLLTRSRARPRLLFACHKHKHGEMFFFSSPQAQDLDENSFPITPSYHMKIPFKNCMEILWNINGLVFLRDERILEGRTNSAKVSVICNPSTGKSLVLSEMKTNWKIGFYSYFGYDPIEKQFKLLSMTTSSSSEPYYTSEEFQVLTLGRTRNMSWRKIECCMPHYPASKVICINGVLYYRGIFSEDTMLVCFDIRFEKFRFLKVGDNITGPSHKGATLINYNGKLGSLCGTSTSFLLWILEDTEKHEWSKHVYVLPPLWKNVVGDIFLDFVGVIGTNIFVFSPFCYSSPFYIFYYNIKRNTIRRVEIQGMEASQGNRVYTFVNHVENIKLIDGS